MLCVYRGVLQNYERGGGGHFDTLQVCPPGFEPRCRRQKPVCLALGSREK